ncbi:cellulase family glycosylhydrolase [Paraconexibacter sp.]|uniref:cellulase family glycosylhydrolase n=1 Tax=Paraconexibacter sp. TaxID=2949640 RepID=UPI0035636DB0
MTRPIALLSTLVALACAAPASAATSQITFFEAPTALQDASTRGQTLDEIKALGSDGIRVLVNWNRLAPDPTSSERPAIVASDPAAYGDRWAPYDAIVDGARSRGLKVLLTLTGGAPHWATASGKDAITKPDRDEFQAFVTAVGSRYADRVDTWSIWNEPNQPQFLAPQFVGGKPYSPRLYRRLYLAAKRGLKASGNADDTVLAAETSPRGNPRIVAPLAFLRGFLCLDSKYRKASTCGKIDADGWAHHPYTTSRGPYFRSSKKDDVTIGTLSRLTRALDRAARAGAIRKSMPLYLTEFGIQSYPDRISGVPLSTQADYRAISELIAYKNRRVKAFSQYLMNDSDPEPKGGSKYSGFESGLRTFAGKKKPAYEGFRLPLTIDRYARGKVRIWGLVRPADARTKVTILYANRGSSKWRTLTRLSTDSRGYFSNRRRAISTRRYRVEWTDGSGTTYRGPVTKTRRLP